MELVLEKMCENLVDVIHETFTRKYYIVKISQSEKDHTYLIVRKKRSRLLYEKQDALHAKIFLTLSPAYLRGTVKDTNNWKKLFFKFKTNRNVLVIIPTIFLFLVIEMSMKIIGKISFSQYSLEFFFNLFNL